jgi:glutamate synthase domain-containing protein 3
MAGERFCVRNSGINAVVEGIGQHGCEYMTGGRVVVLGGTGRNFGAGMSGGVAYVYNEGGDFESRCNKELVLLESVEDERDLAELKTMIENHLKYTGSSKAKQVLDNWDAEVKNFIKVIPKAYKEVINEIERCEAEGMSHEDAVLDAFRVVSGTTDFKLPERSAVNG